MPRPPRRAPPRGVGAAHPAAAADGQHVVRARERARTPIGAHRAFAADFGARGASLLSATSATVSRPPAD
jgi:hypothetical protein